MKWISTRLHAVIDYAAGTLLIVSPWLFGFSEVYAATWVAVVLGGLLFAYSLASRYEFGAVGVFNMQGHLTLDGFFGLFLMASPLLFQFASTVWMPHFFVGVVLLLASLMTRPVATSEPAAPEAQESRRSVRPR